MNIIVRSNCRIQFISDDSIIPERDYSDQSIIQIRQSDNSISYSIEAYDDENNGTEIFNFPLTDRDTYQCGIFDERPDEIEDVNGTYHIWLNEDSRSIFHEALQTIYEVLFPEENIHTDSDDIDMSTFTDYPSEQTKQSEISHPSNCDPKDILTDIRNLNRFIRQGNGDEAAQVVKQFASQGIHLHIDPSKQLQNEEEFRILVQLDGNEYNVNQNGPTIPVNVFPSTTVRELRAAFEVAYQHCPPNQYVFVNGNLVHDDLTMKELNVGLNSLFILYLITYPRQFHTEGPWRCSSCSAQNQPDSLRCIICSASRIE